MMHSRIAGHIIHGNCRDRNSMLYGAATIVQYNDFILPFRRHLVCHRLWYHECCVRKVKPVQCFHIKMVSMNMGDQHKAWLFQIFISILAINGIDIDGYIVELKHQRGMEHRLDGYISFWCCYDVCFWQLGLYCREDKT